MGKIALEFEFLDGMKWRNGGVEYFESDVAEKELRVVRDALKIYAEVTEETRVRNVHLMRVSERREEIR